MASAALKTNPVFEGNAAEPQKQQAVRPEALMRTIHPSRQVLLRFTDICAFVPVLVAPGAAAAPVKAEAADVETGHSDDTPAPSEAASAAKPKERQVLFDVTGVVEPGEILALMGPSGSGKSSLLTVLGGRNRARIGGTLRFNDMPLNKAMKRRMGFVTQDDLLYAELTTYETLYYAAMLRLPKSWTKEQKTDRIEMVLQGLGLDKCRDTIIGNHMMRGVSGGERKRVSIGHELLINPSVILLDEPTSGLDSTTALKLVQTLRGLASGGRTIIASIHQPSSRLYQGFDKLMLLAEGHTMFYGESTACAQWFAMNAVPVPFGVSMPDHLLDLACGDLTGTTTTTEAMALQKRLVAAFEHRTFGLGEHGIQPQDFEGQQGQRVRQPFEEVRRLRDSDEGSGASSPGQEPPAAAVDVIIVAPGGAHAQHQSQQPEAKANGIRGKPSLGVSTRPSSEVDDDLDVQAEGDGKGDASKEGEIEDKWGATFFQQVAILTSRCLRTRRFQSLSIQRFLEVIAVAVLAGLFWFQVGGKNQLTDASISDINGLLFFELLFMSFSSLFQALFAFPADFQMLIKERQSGMYRLSAYYLARMLSDISMDCLVPSIFAIIVYFMGGLRLSAGAFFSNWWSVLLSLLVAQSIGLLLSAIVVNTKTLLSVATILMLGTMLVAGFYVQNVPSWIAWAKYLSFIRYGYILLQKIEFRNRGYSCTDYYHDHPSAPPGMTWCPASASPGLAISDVDTPVTEEVLVLLLWLVVLRILVYVALSKRTTFKTKAN